MPRTKNSKSTSDLVRSSRFYQDTVANIDRVLARIDEPGLAVALLRELESTIREREDALLHASIPTSPS